MAYSITWDIEKGSELREGIENFDLTRSIRRFKVTETGTTAKLDGRQGLIYVIDYVKKWHKVQQDDEDGNGPYVHPLDKDILIHPDYHNTANITTRTGSEETGTDDLPLAYVVATYLRPGVILGEAVYARSALSMPRFDAFDAAREEWYRSGKFVDYIYNGPRVRLIAHPTFDNDFGWYSQMPYRDSIITWNAEITVKTVVPVNPSNLIVDNAEDAFAAVGVSHPSFTYELDTPDGLEDVIRIVNRDEFWINGVKRAPGTLMFTGINIQPIPTAKKLKYLVEYTFDYNPLTFYRRIRYSLSTLCSYILATDWINGGTICDDNGDREILYKEFVVEDIPIALGSAVYYPSYTTVDFNGLFPTHDSPKGYIADEAGDRKAKKWTAIPNGIYPQS